MFLTYIEFFHNLHTKHLKRFSNKIQLMYTHISTDIRFDETIEMNKDKKKEVVDDFTIGLQSENKIKLNVDEIETSNNIIDDEESIKLINDIIENNDDNSIIHNNTPISKDSSLLNDDGIQITDETVFNNFKNISQSCDNLLSKDNIDTVNLINNTVNNDTVNLTNIDDIKNADKGVSEVSDISDDISVMSEIIMDEPENTVKNTVEQSKPKRGRKKKN